MFSQLQYATSNKQNSISITPRHLDWRNKFSSNLTSVYSKSLVLNTWPYFPIYSMCFEQIKIVSITPRSTTIVNTCQNIVPSMSWFTRIYTDLPSRSQSGCEIGTMWPGLDWHVCLLGVQSLTKFPSLFLLWCIQYCVILHRNISSDNKQLPEPIST